MRLKIFLSFYMCFLLLPLFAQLNTQNILRRGQNAIYFDDYVSAIDNFNNIIRVKPYLSEPYFFRGVAKLNLDDNNGAIKDFTDAINLNPNYFFAYMYRGIAYNGLKNYDIALNDYNMAISINPRNPYIYANRGITKANTGDYKGAEKDYSMALMIDNKLEVGYLNRALMREKLDDIKGAMTDCNAVIKLNMFSDDAYSLRGYLWYKQKDHFNAIEDFNKALKIDPENVNVLMNRAMVWYDMKKYREALEDFSKVVEFDPASIHAYYNRAMLRAEVGDYNNALADLDEVVEMNPDNILIFFNRGLLHYEVKEFVEAYNDFSGAIRLYPDFVKAYIARASVNDEMGNHEMADDDRMHAFGIMERYKKMKNGDKNALIDTTENFQRLVDFNAKSDKIREVINGRVQDRHVIVALQDIFYVHYMNIDSLRTGKIKYYNPHVMAYNQEQQYKHSLSISNNRNNYPVEFLQKNIDEQTRQIKQGNEVNSSFLRGIFYLEKFEYLQAIADFEQVLKKQPDHLLAIFNEANARMLMYDYIESVEDRAKMVIGGKEEIIKTKVDYSKVLEGYSRCLALDPDFVFALFNMANVYVKSENIEKAIEMYSKVIEMDNTMAEAYFNRGILYIYVGRKSEASADLSNAGENGITNAYNIIKRYVTE